MDLKILCDELRQTIAEIHAVENRLGTMNQEAVMLHNKMAALQALKARIEVDLTTTHLEVL